MSRGRHSAAPERPVRTRRLPSLPALPARSLKLPALALVGLLGAGVVGAGPQPAEGNPDLAPLSVEPSAADTLSAERGSGAASRSSQRSAPPAAAQEVAVIETAAEIAVVPAAEAAPTPPPVPAVTGQLWTTDAVNVRTAPAADAERVATAEFATAVDVTGTTEGEWSQVVWAGAAAWIKSSFLAESQPEAPQAAAASAGGTSDAACTVSTGIESSLRANARAVYRSVCANFPQVTSYGGIRPGDSGDHGSGRALDIMITGETGWQIARYLQANAGALGITYLIYQQQIWMAGDPASAWSGMEDRGGATANHFDHVHVSTS
ncbi:SH3 domain-containing protein [Cellulosimicrobium protaetiae]|uniref:SH3 domain-containing protein n=1 Tax=Cellulosimicrobium protaetiae TaxID=2587808 RepID=A0A6M5UH09_9MICO|nr:SH3 domain-containing protein [Cellulosimicrobium protaetiae]QJW36368.1 SH3 domain-containing protein [Cellulosimicrobium protaetiae]